MSHNPIVLKAVREACAKRGPLRFDAFMELVLYHPQGGYYLQADRTRIGAEGDFYTSVSATPVFGRIWGGYFRRLLASDPSLENPLVVEFGGHRGQFRDDVLAAAPELDYRTVEAGQPPPAPFDGIVFSNEFIDALPFRRFRCRDGEWAEILVGLGLDGQPREVQEAVEGPPFDMPPPETGVTEVEWRPRAEDWLRDTASRLRRGWMVTVDYGYTREELFAKPRPAGTWRCYHRHRRTDDPLVHMGDQDITADADFTQLIEAGESMGLETVLFADQAHALMEIGQDVIAGIVQRDAGQPSRERNALHQLIHPAFMGQRFRVLVQRRR